jgi:hypothetical protein
MLMADFKCCPGANGTMLQEGGSDMNWAQFVVQWLHVGLGVLWFGAVLYNVTVLIPAISRLPLAAQRQVGSAIGQQGFKVILELGFFVVIFSCMVLMRFGL